MPDSLTKRASRFRLLISDLQEYYFLSARALARAFRKPFYVRDLVDQMDYAGAGTLIIVLPVSLFIGMALTLQIAAEFAILGLQMYTGRVVGISIISEIGPVACGLVFAGRAGSGMASELGTMILRHQVDTIRVFGLDPIKKLIAPRIIASIIMLPALTIIGDMVAMFGGFYIATVVNNQSGAIYWDSIRIILEARYILAGSVKPFAFGFIIASVSCYAGLTTKGGAAGLKISTTRAFVASTILIIIADFVITKLILFFFGYSV